jgi:hypothetical protein
MFVFAASSKPKCAPAILISSPIIWKTKSAIKTIKNMGKEKWKSIAKKRIMIFLTMKVIFSVLLNWLCCFFTRKSFSPFKITVSKEFFSTVLFKKNEQAESTLLH